MCNKLIARRVSGRLYLDLCIHSQLCCMYACMFFLRVVLEKKNGTASDGTTRMTCKLFGTM
jgi:hypothetical protein